MKKLLLLGGLRYLIPVINSAHELGYHVITCDYLPNNIAHKFSDEYINANIIDKDVILKIAQEKVIDGIMSFAVDPGVLTAAYVAQTMGLPGCPYDSVKILQNKVLFRKFLNENGFNVPKAKGYTSFEDALKEIETFDFPLIVKPTDSAGSKGVTRVNYLNELESAIKNAFNNTVADKKIIIEDFIEQSGFSSDSDSFSIDSDLKYVSFSNQYFDLKAANPYTPSAYSWPSYINNDYQNELVSELRRLVKILNIGTSIYNIETRVGKNGKPYIMEVSPRGGGNRLSEMLHYATGVDLIKMAVKSAVGEKIDNIEMPVYKGYWVEVILHADKEGIFDEVKIIPELFNNNVLEVDLWVKKGDAINAFKGANDAIGTVIAKFDSENDMSEFINKISKNIKVYIQ